MPHRREGKELAIQRNVEFGSELAGVEWAAGEVTAANLNSGDFALTVVHADDEVFGVEEPNDE